MNNLKIDVTEPSGANHIFNISIDVEETFEQLADRIHDHVGIDGTTVLESALGQLPKNMNIPLGNFDFKHCELKVNRVCITVHFEAEEKQHWFPKQAKWAAVHRWACKTFQVAHDACANLELREAIPTGAPINEREKIGDIDDCADIWVVKPGPEQNG